jgi:hypothetical protein
VLILLHRSKVHETAFPDAFIDNLVRSWTFTALGQILHETATSSLPFTRYLKDSSVGSSGKSLSFGGQSKEQKLRVSEPKSMIHPSRSSSLNNRRSSGTGEPAYNQSSAVGQVVFENGQYADRPAPTQDSALPQAKNGLQELAGSRAQLVVIQRRVLEQIGKSLGWSIGWAAVLPSIGHGEELSDVDLDDDAESDTEEADAEEKKTLQLDKPTAGLSAAGLLNAVSSIEQFRQFFEVRRGTKVYKAKTDVGEGTERSHRETLHGGRSA